VRNGLKAALEDALRAGGRILIRRFGNVSIGYKGRANIVTEADKESEAGILKILLGRFPDHDVLAEESGSRRRGSEFLWVIDPLDGTTNYAHGNPTACVSIGLLKDGRPIVGGVHDPFRKELFLAEKGRGAFLNGKRIRVSSARSLGESLLTTGFPYDRTEKADFYVRYYKLFMERSHDVRRTGAAALDLAWVAAGRSDGFWEFRLAPWDVAAGLLLIEEAGGRVTDFSGRAWRDPRHFGSETLATNGRIHAAMLKILKA